MAADVWAECREAWLNAKRRRTGRENTARAYRSDLAQFEAWAGVALSAIERRHVEGWAEALRLQKLQATTVRRKLIAVRSFFNYAAEYLVEGQSLMGRANPVLLRDLPQAQRRTPAYFSAEEVQALLRQIGRRTATDWRNLAIIWGLFCTSRRPVEFLGLRGGDLHQGPQGGWWFQYTAKGGELLRQALPEPVMRAIQRYLELADRWPLAAGEFVFVALCANGTRFGHGAGGGPLSRAYVNALLRRYGAAAGIAEERLHAYALRHAGARWHRDEGATAWQLKDLLGHKTLQQTLRYTDDVLSEPEQDAFAGALLALLPADLRRELG